LKIADFRLKIELHSGVWLPSMFNFQSAIINCLT
jgi:hypothetical protein